MDHEGVDSFRKILDENVFVVMEMSKQSYWDTIQMPVYKMKKYTKWKYDLEEERNKIMEKTREKKSNGKSFR